MRALKDFGVLDLVHNRGSRRILEGQAWILRSSLAQRYTTSGFGITASHCHPLPIPAGAHLTPSSAPGTDVARRAAPSLISSLLLLPIRESFLSCSHLPPPVPQPLPRTGSLGHCRRLQSFPEDAVFPPTSCVLFVWTHCLPFLLSFSLP